MRLLAFALALVAASGVARADDDSDEDDEDSAYVAVPKRSVALSLVGHGTRIAGRSEGGVGAALELALGRGRWQYFLEGVLATSSITDARGDVMLGGRTANAGLGARWIARQFRPDRGGGIELFLVSRLGVQRFYFDDGSRVGRPELAVGFGIQDRMYKRPRMAFRFDTRVLFTRSDHMNDDTTGFALGVGFAW